MKLISAFAVCLVLMMNTAMGSLIRKPHFIIEVVTFTAKNGIGSNVIKAYAQSITPILQHYPGFISRRFAQDVKKRNTYIDIIEWRSLSDADSAAKDIVSKKAMQQFISIMSRYKMSHYQCG